MITKPLPEVKTYQYAFPKVRCSLDHTCLRRVSPSQVFTNNPSLLWRIGSSWASTPSWKIWPELGAKEMMFPRFLSYGNDSSTRTEWPSRWHSIAAARPAKPAPTMMTLMAVGGGCSEFGAMMRFWYLIGSWQETVGQLIIVTCSLTIDIWRSAVLWCIRWDQKFGEVQVNLGRGGKECSKLLQFAHKSEVETLSLYLRYLINVKYG